MLSQDYIQRFEGLARVYGSVALEQLQAAHFCIVGIGGVGSWAAEAAARSGIGSITLIDHDDIDFALHRCLAMQGLQSIRYGRRTIKYRNHHTDGKTTIHNSTFSASSNSSRTPSRA